GSRNRANPLGGTNPLPRTGGAPKRASRSLGQPRKGVNASFYCDLTNHPQSRLAIADRMNRTLMPRVASHFPARPHSCCQLGDLAVAKTAEGYRIARVLTMTGPGPAWEQVAMVA